MPQRIQRPATGFLSFLGITGGRSPAESLDEVRPVVDLTPFYTALDLAQSSDTLALAGAQGSEVEVAVPAGEAWHMLGVSLIASTFSVPAVDVVAELHYIAPGGAVQGLNEAFTFSSVAVGDAFRPGVIFPQPFVATSGSRFRAFLPTAAVGGTLTLGVRATFRSLTR